CQRYDFNAQDDPILNEVEATQSASIMSNNLQ
ncbi:MAG: hypothetical protein US96_C0022G0013, partial [Candidatus Woesebacteria bacterium GW2011_GWB1_38_5b]